LGGKYFGFWTLLQHRSLFDLGIQQANYVNVSARAEMITVSKTWSLCRWEREDLVSMLEAERKEVAALRGALDNSSVASQTERSVLYLISSDSSQFYRWRLAPDSQIGIAEL
jgi:hypothetical protein